jgi:hypothetical protein
MNQEQVITEILSQLSLSEKTKLVHQWVCNDPENLQTVLSIFTRTSRTEEEIQETIIDSKPPLTLSDLQCDDELEEGEIHEEPISPPGTVTRRGFTDLDLQRLNQLSSSERRQAIAGLNINDRDRASLVNRLWRLRNPDRVRQNSRRAYQNRRRNLMNERLRHVTFDEATRI